MAEGTPLLSHALPDLGWQGLKMKQVLALLWAAEGQCSPRYLWWAGMEGSLCSSPLMLVLVLMQAQGVIWVPQQAEVDSVDAPLAACWWQC